MAPETPAIGMLVLIGAFAVGFALIAGAFVASQRRSRVNDERAKLFEMGYYLPRRPSRWPQAFFCTAMGLGVPIAALATAATRTSSREEVWVVACIISVAAIVGSTIVAAIVFFRPEPSGQPEKLVAADAKPVSDPDALDFAGRLGRG